MTKENKDKYCNWGVMFLIGFGTVLLSSMIAASKADEVKLNSKADIKYVDGQNDKQDDRIDKVEKDAKDIKGMVTDIWKTLYLNKNK